MPQSLYNSLDVIKPYKRIMCLHGSRQDGELFSQRLKILSKKLSGVAELHFVSAPHELPLAEGQTVAMRAWWRPRNLPQQDQDPDPGSDSDHESDPSLRPQARAGAGVSKPHDGDGRTGGGGAGSKAAGGSISSDISSGAVAVAVASPPPPAGDWDDQIVKDWQKSLQHLAAEWRAAGPFDGLLGFSNGAAAALLLTCHALADPATFPGLQFVILAGGYIRQPLERLVPAGFTAPQREGTELEAASDARLAAPLDLPSLHFMSRDDVVVPYASSLELLDCFRAADRTVVEHSLGHCLPQKAPHIAAVTEFVRSVGASPAGVSDNTINSSARYRGGGGGGGGGGGDGGGAIKRNAVDGAHDVRRTATAAATATPTDPVAAALSGIRGSPAHIQRTLGGAGPAAGSGGRAAGSTRNPPQPPPPHKGQGRGQIPASPVLTAAAAGAMASRAPLRVGTTASSSKPLPSAQLNGEARRAAPLATAATDPGSGTAPAASRAAAAAAAVESGASYAAGPKKGSKSELEPTTQPSAVAKAVTASLSLSPTASSPGLKAVLTTSPSTMANATAAAAASKSRTSCTASPVVAAEPVASAAASAAAITAAVEAVEASDEQREEMDALQAIFMDEYRHISTAPPRFTIHLREPGSADGDAGAGAGDSAVLPSRLFSLTFTLPAAYPTSQPPVVTVTGPLGGNDPRRHALAAHIAAIAREAVESSGVGCVFQVVEAAKDWIDTNLPPGIGERREAAASAPPSSGSSIAATTPQPAAAACSHQNHQHSNPHSYNPLVGNSAVPASAPGGGGGGGDTGGSAAAAAAVAAAASGPAIMNLGWGATAHGIAASTGNAAGIDAWWLREEADPWVIRAALAEAAASAPWRTGSMEPVALTEADAEAAEGLQWGEMEGVAATPPAGGQEPAGGGAVSGGASEWSQRGRWDYVVGLVGKPSAGKSTFFNAVTDPASDEEGARVAAFPFTTIAPNVGRGYCLVPDPAPLLGLQPEQCRPLHGYAEAFSMDSTDPRVANVEPLRRWVGTAGWGAPERPLLWRKVPVVVKDVAGLVPGAYQGRGRGNAFLNDLCDADVLIHVVDASGTTDREGQLLDTEVAEGAEGGPQAANQGVAGGGAGGRGGGSGARGGDPLDDVGWVREELHRWVYDNVRAKWVYVLRKPSRLPELFSGYRASRALVAEVLSRVGVSVGALVVEGASLAHWTEAHLHRLVAHFLQARFPILLALNKADMSSSPDHIARVRQALPYEPAVPVSAATERWLCNQRRAGRVLYADAAGEAAVTSDAPELDQQLNKILNAVLSRYGSTGAALALTCAVAMRPPRAVFPVTDLESYTALPARGISSGAGSLLGSGLDAKARAAEGPQPGVLRDCLLLKPGSNAVDLFEVLKRPPYQLLEGDFVRAECSALTSATAAAAAVAAGTIDGGGGHSLPHQTWRVLKKDEVLDWGSCVARIMTNRRSHWQVKR